MNAHDNRVAVVRLLHPDGRAVHRLAQAFVDITPVITHRLDFTEFEEGFAAMRSGKSGKVILDWRNA